MKGASLNRPPKQPRTLLSLASTQRLCAAVTRFSGVRLAETSTNMVENRLLKFMAARGLVDGESLVAQVCANPKSPLANALFEAMLNNETLFFRDPRLFAELRDWALPELLAKRAQTRRLDIWCAACSTGQEPYSVAMLLASYFPEELEGWSVNILATDICHANIARAAQGTYTKLEVNRGLPAAMLPLWLSKTATGWRVDHRLRAMVNFRQLSLLDDWPELPAFDLVLLRNVMIYWEPDDRVAVLTKVSRVVADHGYLVVGGAELVPSTVNFKLATAQRWPFYRPFR